MQEKKDAKKRDIIRIIYLIFIIIFTISFLITAYVKLELLEGYESPDKAIPGGVTDYYWNVFHFPKREAADFALVTFLLLINIYLLLDYFIFYHKKGWKKGLFIFLSMVVIFIGTEVVFWRESNMEPSMFRPHPVWLWHVTPNLKDYNYIGDNKVMTNSFGFRNPDFPIKKPSGQFRIMLLGDSSAHGFCVTEEETFAAILEEKLREKYPGKDILVINAANPGSTTTMGRVFLEDYGRKFEPDVLIISYNNDHMLEKKTDKQKITTPALRPFYRILYKSLIYLQLRKMIVNEMVRRNPSLVIINPDESAKYVSRVPLDEYRDNIKYFSEFTKKRGGKTVVIQMPKKFKVPEYQKSLEESSIKNNCHYLDAAKEFDGMPRDEMFADIIHPSKKGHEKIADLLFELFVNDRIIQ